jgi:YVTN family beta-propeller protein
MNRGRKLIAHPILVFVSMLGGLNSANAQRILATIPVGTNPSAIAVNIALNKIYVANQGSNNVTVIDGATNSTTTVPVGTRPSAIAVNPVTATAYVANAGSNDVTVISGASNSTSTVTVGSGPSAIAINPVTNTIYVFDATSQRTSVIDGATNKVTATFGLGTAAMAINTITNTVYMADGSLAVVDGTTGAYTTPPIAIGAESIAVDEASNFVYIAAQCITGKNCQNDAYLVYCTGQCESALGDIVVGLNPNAIAMDVVAHYVFLADGGPAGSEGGVDVFGDVGGGEVDIGKNSLVLNQLTGEIFAAYSSTGYVGAATLNPKGTFESVFSFYTGTNPDAIAVNPLTKYVYVANGGSNTVTVIDPSNYAAPTDPDVTIPTGAVAAAINPVTNKIYTDDAVINGKTLGVTPLSATGRAIAVDPVTNTILLGNTLIDGATNAATTITAGTNPWAAAVNPVTNKFYIANHGSANVTVLNGATHVTSTVPAGMDPTAVALNPVTNKIYVANTGNGTVTVIDGTTNTPTTLTVGGAPLAIAVNPVTNKIYVAGGGLTVIDGSTNDTSTEPVGGNPVAVAVNTITNQIYVAYATGITVIDGATNSTTNVSAGTDLVSITLDEATNKIYALDYPSKYIEIDASSSTSEEFDAPSLGSIVVNPITHVVYLIGETGEAYVLLPAYQETPTSLGMAGLVDSHTITGLQVFATTNPSPRFIGSAHSEFSSTTQELMPTAFYYQLDTEVGNWQAATRVDLSATNPAYYEFTLSNVPVGVHTIYFFAICGNELAQPVAFTFEVVATS